MDECVIRCLTKIKKATSWRSDKDLRDTIDNICGALKDERKRLKKRGVEFKDTDADKYWGCLVQGLENKAPGVKAATMEAITTLILEGYLHGEAEPLRPLPNKEDYTMMEEIAKILCEQKDVEDDNMMAALAQSLAEVVKMGTVNGEFLLRSIDVTHHIYMNATSGTTREAAEESVKEIMTFLMQSMDYVDKTKDAEIINSEMTMTPTPYPEDEDGEDVTRGFMSDCLYTGVEMQMGFHYDNGVVGWNLETEEEEEEEECDEQKLDTLPSQRHRDIYLVFRRLCAIASKEDGDDDKIFSLTAIKAAMENIGDDFNKYKAYVYLVRRYLLQNLLQNFISNNMDVVEVSLHIFTPLVNKFRIFIKKEIEVFIINIFLVILNSQNSAMRHKEMVIEAFNEINKDPNFMIELFINYDCDINSRSMYEDVVRTLANVVEGKYKVVNRRKEENENGEVEEIVEEEDVFPEEETIDEELLPAKRIALDALAHILQPLAEKCHITEAENNNTNTNQKTEEEEELTPGFTPVVVQASDTDVKIKQATDILQKFDEKRKYQEDMQTGYAKFNKKPRAGIEFLVQAGRLENTPEAVAQFLYKNHEFLDKREIGDYMGEPKEFNLAVLKAYADGINFRGLDFDMGIRTFLERFRLPGEAQKIDRMIERFANAFCDQNPGLFVNTDAAFVLGYSVIMLNTDLHNPNIAPENRMTPEGFIRNCRGINDGGDFPREYLIDIYDRIQANAISLKEDDMAREAQAQKKRFRNKEERRQKAFSVEKMDIMSKLKVDIDDETTEYFEATGNEYIGPMFKIMFPMIIDVYAKVLELSDDEQGIQNTLTGVKDCFEISCALGLDQERDRSMKILSENTLVDEMEWLDVKNKQIEMIRVMLELAQNFGNHMGSAWKYILAIISSLAQVHLYGLEDLARKHIAENEEDARVSRSGEYVLVEQAQEKQELINSIIDLRSLDRIFAKTANLDNKMIVEFVKALCDVSLTELKASLNDEPGSPTPAAMDEEDKRPRLYLMQKVVEVADSNMYCRSRMEWTQIWQVMSEYYIALGCFPMGQVALSAIDALKQLSVKFLDKEDLRAYNFQKSFIRPFEYVISRTPSADTREMILHVVHNIVQTRSKQLSSGWKIVFSVCTFCAENEADPLTSIAWSMAKELFDTYFDCMVPEMNDLTTTYCAFIGVEAPVISQEAREYVTKCADAIIAGKVVSTKETNNMFTDSDDHTKVWWPVFMGLSRYVYNDARYHVRNDCCERIFAVFQNPDVHFSEKLWELVFTGFIFSIFDGPMKSGVEAINSLMAATQPEDKPIALGTKAESAKPWLQTTGALVMYSIIRLYVKRREQIAFLLPKIFELMQQAMHQSILSLARVGVFCLKQIMQEGADMYDENMWDVLLGELEKAFLNSMPHDLVMEARRKLSLIYDKSLRAGGVAPKVGHWVRTPVGNGKLISVDDICATVELLYGNAYFHKLGELEDLEKLKKEEEKKLAKKRASKKSKKDSDESSSDSESESESESEKKEAAVEDDEGTIKLETTDKRSLDLDAELVHTKSVVQEDLAALVSELIDNHYARFTFGQVKKMLGLMQQVADMTRDFHQDAELRQMVKKLGFPKEDELLPTLIYEQVAVETSIVHVLFVLYMDSQAPDRQEYANNDLLKRMEFLLTEYVEVEKKAHTTADLEKKENERVAIASIPLITEVLTGINKTPYEKFVEYCPKFYPLFMLMIQYSGEEVRAGLSTVFSTKIQKMLFP